MLLLELAVKDGEACQAYLQSAGVEAALVAGVCFDQDSALVAAWESKEIAPLLIVPFVDKGQAFLVFFSRGHAVVSGYWTDQHRRAVAACGVLGVGLINAGEADEEPVIHAKLLEGA